MENQVDFVRDKFLSLSWTLIPFENTEFDNTQRALNFHLRDGPTVYWPIVSIVAYYIKYKWDNENGKVVGVWYIFH